MNSSSHLDVRSGRRLHRTFLVLVSLGAAVLGFGARIWFGPSSDLRSPLANIEARGESFPPRPQGEAVAASAVSPSTPDQVSEPEPAQTAANESPKPQADAPAVAAPSTEASREKASSEDERIQRALVGTWKGYCYGPRTLTLREDGTATMISEPEGVAATFIASRLEFEIKWTVRDGKVSFETIGGRPEAKVKMVTRLYGSSRTHPILERSENRVVLEDTDGSEQVWERIRETQ